MVKSPLRSDSHPRGIFSAQLCWAGQDTVYGMGQRRQSHPALHSPAVLTQLEGEDEGDEIPRRSVQTGERHVVCL